MQSTMVGRIVRVACAGILGVGWAAPGWAQSSTSIDRQTQVFWNSVETVLGKYDQDTVRKVRLAGVGSWMSGEAGELSDIDATLAHPNPAIQKQIVTDINNEISRQLGEKHSIKLIYEKDPKFSELFRGETGEKFFRDYADKKAGGRAAFLWSRDEAGQLVRHQVATERFWLDRGLNVPENLTRAHTFVEDAVVFMTNPKVVDGVVVEMTAAERAMKAAKYLDNAESWLGPGLVDEYGDATRVLFENVSLGDDMRQQMAKLMELKKKLKEPGFSLDAAQDELREFYKTSLKVDELSDAQLTRKLDEFFEGTKQYLVRYRDQVDLVDHLAQSNALGRVRDLERAVSMRSVLWTRLGEIAGRFGKAFVAADAYAILDRYYLEGEDAAAEELALTLVGYGLPEAQVVAMVASIAKDLTSGMVTAAGQLAIFGPINDLLLKTYYADRTNDLNIFRMEDSPFQGLTRETLWIKFPFSDPEVARARLSEAADQYVQALKQSHGAMVPSEGAGRLQDPLVERLFADWLKSKEIADRIKVWARSLKDGLVTPALRPLRVFVNGEELQSRKPRMFQAGAAVGGPEAAYRIEIMRQFARVRRLSMSGLTNAEAGTVSTITQKGGSGWEWMMLQVWGKGGMASLRPWVDRHTIEEYATGSLVHLGLSVTGAQGWRGRGGWRTVAPGNGGTWETDVGKLRGDGRQSFAQVAMEFTFAPDQTVRQPVEVELGLRLTPEAPPESPAETLNHMARLVTRPQAAETQPTTKPADTGEWAKVLDRATTKVDGQLKQLDSCLAEFRDYLALAQKAVERARDPKVPSSFACDRNTQVREIADDACCKTYYATRDQKGMGEEAWLTMQQCGWKVQVQKRQRLLADMEVECRKRLLPKR